MCVCVCVCVFFFFVGSIVTIVSRVVFIVTVREIVGSRF